MFSPVSYQAPIFHSASSEIRYRDHIHLRQRELDLEIILVIPEYSRADVQAVVRLINGVVARPNFEVAVLRCQKVEIGNYEGHQIRGHRY